MFRSITEPFKALELTFPNGTIEFWKNDVEEYGQFYERVGYELKASGSLKASEVCKVRALGADDQYYDLTDPDMHRVIWEIRDVASAADKFKAVITFTPEQNTNGATIPQWAEVYVVGDTAPLALQAAATYLDTRPHLTVKTVHIERVYPADAPITVNLTISDIPVLLPV